MKRLLSLILSLAVLMSTLTLGSFAACAYTEGDYEYTVLDDGTAIITGYNGSDETLRIPETLDGKNVTAIDEAAFINNESIVNLYLPSELKTIGDMAFLDCRMLTDIYFNDKLESIGENAFRMCGALTGFTLPASLRSIGDYAFCGSEWIPEVKVNSANPYFRAINGVLYSSDVKKLVLYPVKSNADEFTVPETVEEIGVAAFYGATKIKVINIPRSVTLVDEDAFENCSFDSVVYASTEYRWGKIEIKDGNASLKNASRTTAGPCSVHVKENTEVVTEPTCVDEGELRYVCSECGETVTEPIEPLGHIAVTLDAVEPTCTETGLTEGSFCSRCSNILTEQTVIEALGHNYEGSEITLNWNSSYEGSVRYWTADTATRLCSRCGAADTAAVTVTQSVTKEATEEEDGSIEFTASFTFDSTEHTEKKTEIIPRLDHTHSWGDPEFVFSDDGKTVTAVRRCVKDPTHINEAESVTVTSAVKNEPTCTETGDTLYTAEAVFIDEFGTVTEASATKLVEGDIQPLGHIEVNDDAVPPTCTETGLTQGVHCSRCSTVLVAQQVVDALGHDMDAGTVTEESDCTASGVRTFKCKRCEYSYTEEIPAKGHTPVTDPAVAATFFDTGLTEGCHCEVCEAILTLQETVPKLVLAVPSGLKLTRRARGFTAVWNKNPKASGYILQYSLSPKFTKKKTITVKGRKNCSKTVKKLKAKKRYYVRVRAYVTSDGKTARSKFSKAVKVTTK